eukprot:scaffold2739_cov257-Pinguiococcus_pyrenoidosus.AAC.39
MRAWVGLALYSIAYAAVPSDLGADVFVETAESPAQNSNQKAIDSLQSLAPDFLQNFKSIETQTLKTKEEQNAIEDVVDRLDGADYARDRFGTWCRTSPGHRAFLRNVSGDEWRVRRRSDCVAKPT